MCPAIFAEHIFTCFIAVAPADICDSSQPAYSNIFHPPVMRIFSNFCEFLFISEMYLLLSFWTAELFSGYPAFVSR
jgi:hypothetical protein